MVIWRVIEYITKDILISPALVMTPVATCSHSPPSLKFSVSSHSKTTIYLKFVYVAVPWNSFSYPCLSCLERQSSFT